MKLGLNLLKVLLNIGHLTANKLSRFTDVDLRIDPPLVRLCSHDASVLEQVLLHTLGGSHFSRSRLNLHRRPWMGHLPADFTLKFLRWHRLSVATSVHCLRHLCTSLLRKLLHAIAEFTLQRLLHALARLDSVKGLERPVPCIENLHQDLLVFRFVLRLLDEVPVSFVDFHEPRRRARRTDRSISNYPVPSLPLEPIAKLALTKHRKLEPLRLIDHVLDVPSLLILVTVGFEEQFGEAFLLTFHLFEKLVLVGELGAELVQLVRDLLIEDVCKEVRVRQRKFLLRCELLEQLSHQLLVSLWLRRRLLNRRKHLLHSDWRRRRHLVQR